MQVAGWACWAGAASSRVRGGSGRLMAPCRRRRRTPKMVYDPWKQKRWSMLYYRALLGICAGGYSIYSTGLENKPICVTQTTFGGLLTLQLWHNHAS